MSGEHFYWNAKTLVEREKDAVRGVTRKYWLRVGSAKSSGDSDVIEVTIDAIPLNWNGKVSLFPVDEAAPTGGGE